MSSGNFVHDLDRCTSEIVSAIISAQSNADCVNRFAVPHTDETVRVLLPRCRSPLTHSQVQLPHPVTMARLRRIRRQFLKMCRLTPPPSDKVGEAFVAYLLSDLKN